MASAELPDTVRRLVHDWVPTLEALEILLLVARDPGRDWRADAVVRLLAGRVAEADVHTYLDVLVAAGLAAPGEGPGAYRFAPRTTALTEAVEGIIVAYHQRPVTLIRTIYEGADLKSIRSFADAFRLRGKE